MKKILIPVVSILIIIGVGYVWHAYHPKLDTSQKEPLVVLSPVTVQNVPLSVQTTGTLVANQQTYISPKAGGYITSIDFQEGQFVKEGAVLLTLDDSKEKQAYLSAQAQANLDKATYQRYLKLSSSGIVSPQDLEQYRSKSKQSDAAAISANVTLSQMTLVAPFDGYLGERSVSIGNYVNVGQNLVSITDTNKLRVEYSLPSRYVDQLNVGQQVTMTSDFLPGQHFNAVVDYIAPTVDPATQTIEVHASYDNKQQKLKPGQSVNVNQMLGTKPKTVLIPSDALIANINGNYVYQVQNNKVVSTPVVPGQHYKSYVMILKGIKMGDKIITQGQFQVKEGQTVRIDNTK